MFDLHFWLFDFSKKYPICKCCVSFETSFWVYRFHINPIWVNQKLFTIASVAERFNYVAKTQRYICMFNWIQHFSVFYVFLSFWSWLLINRTNFPFLVSSLGVDSYHKSVLLNHSAGCSGVAQTGVLLRGTSEPHRRASQRHFRIAVQLCHCFSFFLYVLWQHLRLLLRNWDHGWRIQVFFRWNIHSSSFKI